MNRYLMSGWSKRVVEMLESNGLPVVLRDMNDLVVVHCCFKVSTHKLVREMPCAYLTYLGNPPDTNFSRLSNLIGTVGKTMHLDSIDLVGLEVSRAAEPNIQCAQLYDIHYFQDNDMI